MWKNLFIFMGIAILIYIFVGWYYADIKSQMETPFRLDIELEDGNILLAGENGSANHYRNMYGVWYLDVKECDCIGNGQGEDSFPFTLNFKKYGAITYGDRLPIEQHEIVDDKDYILKGLNDYQNKFKEEHQRRTVSATCIRITQGHLWEHPQRYDGGMYTLKK